MVSSSLTADVSADVELVTLTLALHPQDASIRAERTPASAIAAYFLIFNFITTFNYYKKIFIHNKYTTKAQKKQYPNPSDLIS